jgi:hypothetical protein
MRLLEVRLVRPAGAATVQQESTATGLDAGGLEWTREDGDLHRDTRVDGLPLDGMQEVRSSNLLSSTPGQPHNSNNLKRDFERLVALPGRR